MWCKSFPDDSNGWPALGTTVYSFSPFQPGWSTIIRFRLPGTHFRQYLSAVAPHCLCIYVLDTQGMTSHHHHHLGCWNTESQVPPLDLLWRNPHKGGYSLAWSSSPSTSGPSSFPTLFPVSSSLFLSQTECWLPWVFAHPVIWAYVSILHISACLNRTYVLRPISEATCSKTLSNSPRRKNVFPLLNLYSILLVLLLGHSALSAL